MMVERFASFELQKLGVKTIAVEFMQGEVLLADGVCLKHAMVDLRW